VWSEDNDLFFAVDNNRFELFLSKVNGADVNGDDFVDKSEPFFFSSLNNSGNNWLIWNEFLVEFETIILFGWNLIVLLIDYDTKKMFVIVIIILYNILIY
jgi:hypothetical protein